MASTFFPNDQSPPRRTELIRLVPRAAPAAVRTQTGNGAPDLRTRLNLAAGVIGDRDKIKIAVSGACIALGATGTVAALLGFPVTGTMLAMTGVVLVFLADTVWVDLPHMTGAFMSVPEENPPARALRAPV